MQLLRIRYYQIRRDLQFSFFLLVALVLWVSNRIYEPPAFYGWQYSALVIFILFSLQKGRRDLHFLFSHSQRPYFQLLAEYQLVLLMVSIPALFHQQYLYFGAIHATGCFLPLVKPRQTETLRFKFLGRWIPTSQYEWISGMRQQLIILLPLYLVALILSPVKLFPLVALWIINLSIQGFYIACEPVHVLHALNGTATDILKQKIRFALRLFALINGPVLVINLMVQRDGFIPILLFTIYSIAGICLAICTKYSYYKPGDLQRGLAGHMVINNMVLFSPYLLPVPLLMLWRNWHKAVKNLQFYL